MTTSRIGSSLVFSLVLLLAATASAGQPIICTGLLTGTVDGDVVVPSGETCTLAGVTVNGDIKVEPGGSLTDDNVSFNAVYGDIKGENTGSVGLSFTVPDSGLVVTGDFKIKGATFGISMVAVGGASIWIGGDVKIEGSSLGGGIGGLTVEGDVKISNNTDETSLFPVNLQILNNEIGGDLKVDDNTLIGGGEIFIDQNIIMGDLRAEGNSPAPVAFIGNTVAGDMRGQAAGL